MREIIDFCHIVPTPYLGELTSTNGAHLILAHLVESDPVYRDFYANLDDGKYKIMDNSAFEMYKAGRPMYPSEKLIEMGEACKADCIVMTDYPGEKGQKTIDAAERLIPQFRAAGFDNFFVPQSEVGDLDDYMNTLYWAIDNLDVGLIGMSILGCPNAFGVEKSNNLQRYLSRYRIFNIIAEDFDIEDGKLKDRFHCLGMVDGPNEIDLLRPFHRWIRTWDSSAAPWAGLNGIKFDNSPTGLINGKFEKEVDFDFSGASVDDIELAWHNIEFINDKVM